MICGDVALSATDRVAAIFFNKELVKNYLNDVNLYETVNDGKWTVEYFMTLINDTYSDMNGNGERDINDFYGYCDMCGFAIPSDVYFSALGNDVTVTGSNGLPELSLYTERSSNSLDLILRLQHNINGSYSGKDKETTVSGTSGYGALISKFISSEVIFIPYRLDIAEQLRNMKDDYGVIPFFKYNEQQENYRTICHDAYSIISVMTTTTKTNVVGAALELLSEESYNTVTPTYFEVALKSKYSSSNEDSQMYDLILEGRSFNFGVIYASMLENPIWLWRDQIKAENNVFASAFSSKETSINKALIAILDFYK